MQLKNTRYMQYLATITGALACASSALYGTWPSPILPKIASGNSPLGIVSPAESSWIVSSTALGIVVGSIFSGWTLEKFGRKGSLLTSGFPLFLAWYIIAFTELVWVVCAARVFSGIAMANAISSVMLYTGEIAEKEVRGRLGSIINIFGLFGEILPLCVGPYISYRTLTISSSAIPLAFLVSFYFMPESPYYLVKIGKENRAKTSLKFLLSKNISDDTLEKHLNCIKTTVEDEMKNKNTLWEFLLKKEYRKSLVIALGVHTVSQLSGFPSILAYMQTIMEYSNDSIPSEISSVLCGVVQLPTVFIAAAIVDKAGRKPLLIISLIGCAVGVLSIGVYFYLQNVALVNIDNVSWIPTAGVLIYIIMRPIGIGTLTFVLMGELFTTNIKGHAIAVSSFYRSILSFIAVKSFEPISSAWGLHVVFGFYGLICLLGIVFINFVLPETKGKTFAEIQNQLNNNKKN